MAVNEPVPTSDDKTKYIMLALRRALLLIVVAIEQAYNIDAKERIVIVIER